MSLATLHEAIGWLADKAADDRPVPHRLHDMTTDPQGELGTPRFTASFLGYINARPDDVGQDGNYRSPLWRALHRIRGRRHAPTIVVLHLMADGYDWRRTCERLGMDEAQGEALILLALRSVWGEYQHAPLPRRSWIDLSESQQAAEMAVAM